MNISKLYNKNIKFISYNKRFQLFQIMCIPIYYILFKYNYLNFLEFHFGM